MRSFDELIDDAQAADVTGWGFGWLDGRATEERPGVGPSSAFELIEFFLGPLPDHRHARDPQRETAAAERAGLTVTHLRTARCRMEFFDVGAIVYVLRKCVWWVPDFTVERYRDQLRRLDARIRSEGTFVAHSTRHLIEARR